MSDGDHDTDHGCGVTHDDIERGRYAKALEIAMQRLHGEHQGEHLTLIGDSIEVGACHMGHLMPSAVLMLVQEINEQHDGVPSPKEVLSGIFQAGVVFGRALQEFDAQTIFTHRDENGVSKVKVGMNVGFDHGQ